MKKEYDFSKSLPNPYFKALSTQNSTAKKAQKSKFQSI